MHRKKVISLALAGVFVSIALSGCGKTYTVESCAQLLDQYIQGDMLNKLNCRMQLEELGQSDFDASMAEIQKAVDEGRTLQSDAEAGLDQFKSDLGIE